MLIHCLIVSRVQETKHSWALCKAAVKVLVWDGIPLMCKDLCPSLFIHWKNSVLCRLWG